MTPMNYTGDTAMGEVIELGVEAGRIHEEDARAAQESWMRHCRTVADERKAIVMRSLPDSTPLRLLVSLLIDAERDHAKAEWLARGK